MGKVNEIIVEKDQDIKIVINDYITKKGWKSAYISGGIGSIRDIELTTPVDMTFPPKVEIFSAQGPGEVLAFTGEVMAKEDMDPALKDIYSDDKEELFIHIHASVALQGSKVYGGGLKSGKAFRKIKIYILGKK